MQKNKTSQKGTRKTRAQEKINAEKLITEDLSPEMFFQKPPIKNQLKINELKWTNKQREFFKVALDDQTRVMFLSGPAGTSKTIMAVYAGLRLLNQQKISDIMYLRSAVESSESRLGFLPGSAEEKLAFYNLPFLDKLDELVCNASATKLEKEGRISMFPVNFARGMNWNGKFIILDEAQNSSFKEIVTVLTRLGHGTKCFVLGDPMQTDLRNACGSFNEVLGAFSNNESREKGIHTFELNEDDILRSEIVKFIVKTINCHQQSKNTRQINNQ